MCMCPPPPCVAGMRTAAKPARTIAMTAAPSAPRPNASAAPLALVRAPAVEATADRAATPTRAGHRGDRRVRIGKARRPHRDCAVSGGDSESGALWIRRRIGAGVVRRSGRNAPRSAGAQCRSSAYADITDHPTGRAIEVTAGRARIVRDWSPGLFLRDCRPSVRPPTPPGPGGSACSMDALSAAAGGVATTG